MSDEANMSSERQSAPASDDSSLHILILAPTSNDAKLTAEFLTKAGIEIGLCRNLSQLCEGIDAGAAAAIVAEEALESKSIPALLETLERQPSWSDMPIILITSGGEITPAQLRRMDVLRSGSNITILERPFRPSTLLSTVYAALNGRRRQYQVQDLLSNVQASETRLQKILQSISDGFLALDSGWNFSYLNDSCLKLISPLYPSANLVLHKNLWELFPDLVGTEVERSFRKARADQRMEAFEFFYKPLDGWFDIRAYPSSEGLSVYLRDITERKRQEAAFAGITRKMEAQARVFDTTLSHIPDFAYILDREGRFLFANKPMLDFLGLSLEETIGKDFADLRNPPELPAQLKRQILHIFEAKQAIGGETRYTSLSGKQGYYEYILSPVFGVDGSVEAVAGSTRDITQRRASEAANQQLAAIVESSGDAIISKDLEGIIQSWNQGAERLFLYEAEEIIGRSVRLLIPADRLYEEEHILARIIRGERVENYETVRRRKDGSLVDISLTVSPIKSAAGQIVGASKIARDITDRKKATESLIAHARRAEMLSAIAGELLLTDSPRALLPSIFARAAKLLAAEHYFNYLVSDDGSRFILASSSGLNDSQRNAFSRLSFGEALANLSGQRRTKLIINNLQECDPESASQLRQLGVRGYACYPLQVGGRLLGIASFASKSRLSFEWEDLRFIMTLCDLVASSLERSRLLNEVSVARDNAERASQAKDQFLATLSHELRTPLSPVLLLAGAAADNPALPENVRADFRIIRKNITLEARLIDDLLDLTRITRGKLHIAKKACDIHSILEDAIVNVQTDIQDKRIAFARDFRAEEHHTLGDPVRLQQIFWNILKNAVKFTPPEGRVSVTTDSTTDRFGKLLVRITDSGIGMTSAELSRAFDAFFQGHHAQTDSSRYGGGLGLGLSISRKLAELHSGEIRAESNGSGQGAVFTVELPLLSSPSSKRGSRARHHKARQLSEGRNSSARRPRILLVEDHEDSRVALSWLLRLKYEVVEATSGAEARLQAQKERFDVVISDIGLPDQTGYELMAALQEEYDLKGIALTGYGMEDDVVRSRQAGFLAHLTKPVEADRLDQVLAEVLENSQRSTTA
jgi:PAS domain S-box-containing protein